MTVQAKSGRGPAACRGIVMYRVVYWTGVTLLVVWSVFSAYSAITGL
jgi:hypothetical protein